MNISKESSLFFGNIGFNLESSSSHDRPMLLPRLGDLEATDFNAFGV